MAAPCGESAVVGVDLTPASALLVDRLGVLSRIGVTHLTLVHVLGGHYPQIPQLRHVAHDASRLEQLVTRTEHGALSAAVEVRTGHVADQLEQAARHHGAGLIAIGARGRTPLRGLLLGSTVLDLVVHAHRPVLLVPVLAEPTGQRSDGGVLVATDASPAAREAERLGTALAAVIGGQAITVVPAEDAGIDAPAAAEERVRALAQAQRLTARGLPCTVEAGGVPETIARIADERDAALIVLGCARVRAARRPGGAPARTDGRARPAPRSPTGPAGPGPRDLTGNTGDLAPVPHAARGLANRGAAVRLPNLTGVRQPRSATRQDLAYAPGHPCPDGYATSPTLDHAA